MEIFWLALLLIVTGVRGRKTEVDAEILEAFQRGVMLGHLLGGVKLGGAKPFAVDHDLHFPVNLTLALEVLLRKEKKHLSARGH